MFPSLLSGIVRAEVGEEGYARLVAARTSHLGRGDLTYAVEASHNDGPFEHPKDSQRYNGLVRYRWWAAGDEMQVTAMGYHGTWNSTDQVPTRAIEEGMIGRFGSLDPTDGGASDRYSLSFDWKRKDGEETATTLNAYAIYIGSISSRISPTSSTIRCPENSSSKWIAGSSSADRPNTIGMGSSSAGTCITPSACKPVTTSSPMWESTTPRPARFWRRCETMRSTS